MRWPRQQPNNSIIISIGDDRLFDTTLFNVSFPDVTISESKSLILSGCRVSLSENTSYSEFEELNCYSLNCNDYGFGRTDIELSFENMFHDPYFKFYIQCVAIRADNEVLCKINRNPMPKADLLDNHTKVTKHGKMAVCLGYYFKTEKERLLLVNSKSFCIEGFVALKKKTNVYAFACQIEKTDDGWKLEEGNTYRIYKHVNIRGLYH